MIDVTAVIITIELLATIVILAGLVLWLDRKQSERLDRMDKRMDDLQEEMREGMREMRTDMRALDTKVEVLDTKVDTLSAGIKVTNTKVEALDIKANATNSKVDRMQGTLDVLVFGERGVPPPVARERAEAEARVQETVGD